MEHPTIPLGVDMMDQDHLRLERLFAAAVRTSDADLPALQALAAVELAAHFAREEDLLRDIGFPGLHCHVAQHAVLLGDLAALDCARLGAAETRRRLGVLIPQLVLSHVATMDRMAAAFIKGEIGAADFDGLRLPLPLSQAAQ